MSYPIKYAGLADFQAEVKTNPDLQTDIKTDPVAVMNTVKESPLDTDVWIYRIVVVVLGAAILAVTIGVVIMVFDDKPAAGKEIPAILTAIGSGAIGALTGLLAPSPARKNG